jgi:hypothetical protein
MIMSKDQVITEIRELKAGAKGLLTYRKAHFPVECGVGNLFISQWPFQRNARLCRHYTFAKPIRDLCLVMRASDTLGKTTSRFF